MLTTLLKAMTGACGHRHVGWPQHNQQRCLECGSARFYDVQAGTRGEWMPPERPGQQHEVEVLHNRWHQPVAVSRIRVTV